MRWYIASSPGAGLCHSFLQRCPCRAAVGLPGARYGHSQFLQCKITAKTVTFSSCPPVGIERPHVYFLCYAAPSLEEEWKVLVERGNIWTFIVWGHSSVLKQKPRSRINKQTTNQKEGRQLEHHSRSTLCISHFSSVFCPPPPPGNTRHDLVWASSRDVNFGEELSQIMLQSWEDT